MTSYKVGYFVGSLATKSINRLLKKDLPLRQVRGFELDPRAVPPPRAPRSASPARGGRPRGATTGTSRRSRAAAR